MSDADLHKQIAHVSAKVETLERGLGADITGIRTEISGIAKSLHELVRIETNQKHLENDIRELKTEDKASKERLRVLENRHSSSDAVNKTRWNLTDWLGRAVSGAIIGLIVWFIKS